MHTVYTRQQRRGARQWLPLPLAAALGLALGCTSAGAQAPPTAKPRPQADKQQPRFPDFPDQDALRYSLDLKVDIAHKHLQGTVSYEIRALAPLTEVRLHALHSEAWRISFTDPQGKPLATDWSKEPGIAVVALPQKLAKGSIVRLQATIAGTPVDGFYFRDNRYGQPLVFTDHYAIRARGWLPCEDHPADRAKWRLHLVYPAADQAVAFGVAGKDPGPPPPKGYRALTTSSDVEIPPYMFAIVVGPFDRVAEAGDPRLVPHYVYRTDVANARRLLVHDAAWIHAMETTFGRYPFGKYTTVQCPTRWGGFEAPGNVQLAENLFDRDRSSTLAHELVHMWFGDGVGYRHWREVWLSEGFASYFGPWLVAQTGGPTLRQSLRRMRAIWRASAEGRTKSVRDDQFLSPDQALNANTYPKGAWVLHMLRGELGDAKFFAALKAYFAKCVGRAVVTSDFVDVVDAVAGRDLHWFFNQWLDRPDCPHLHMTAAAGGRVVVTQTQPGAPYRFWLRLGWRGADGKERRRRIRVEQHRTEVQLDVGVGTRIEIDPDVELLFRRQ